MSHTTERVRGLIEQRERHRWLLRGAAGHLVKMTQPEPATQPDEFVEERLREALDALLTDDSQLLELLTQRAPAAAFDGASDLLGKLVLPRAQLDVARAALGESHVTASEPEVHSDAWDRYLAFVGLALAADIAASDGYTDPRLVTGERVSGDGVGEQ